MRSRYLVDGASVVAVALFLGWVLSLATTRVKNWFVMTDELYYERLAVSVAQTGSLLPRLHGELVPNVNQLYPVLISPLYGDGNVPASFAGAHRLNAFLIASAAIPVYLLARRIGLGRLVSLWAGALSVAVPWVALASFLLTEVVAYPAFCWALLALTHAVARKSWRTDLLALVVIGVAVLARTQFVVLLAVFVVAVVVEAMLDATPRGAPREPLAHAAALRAPLRRRCCSSSSWRSRSARARSCSALTRSPPSTCGSTSGSCGSRSSTWRCSRSGSRSCPSSSASAGSSTASARRRPGAERAFAVVGSTALLLVTLQVASFNQRFGAGLVKDRYLFYVVPIVLVGLAAALGSRQWPRWWALVVPTLVAAIGFASAPLALYEKFNVDSPIAILNNELLELATSTRWAHVLLVLAALVAAQALLLAKAFVPWRPTVIAVAVLASVALPLETVYAFDRLFAVNGTNGLPVTLDQGVVFSWVDRNVGPTGRVTVMKYPVGGPDWWAGQGYWWDVEFWNESAVETMADMSLKKTPHWRTSFDPQTGAALDAPETQFAFFYKRGRPLPARRQAASSTTARPTSSTPSGRGGRPGSRTASIPTAGRGRTGPRRSPCFAEPGQKTALRRFLTISVASPDPLEPRPVTITLEPRRAGALDPSEHVRGPRPAGLRPGRRDGPGHRRDADRVGGLSRPDQVRALGPHRPPGRRPDPHRSPSRTSAHQWSAARREVGCTPTRAVSSVGRAPARQAGGHWFEPSTAHSP